MKASRNEVYERIDGERQYQDEKYPQIMTMSLPDYFLGIRSRVEHLMLSWPIEMEDAQIVLREVAAISVAGLQCHGVLPRVYRGKVYPWTESRKDWRERIGKVAKEFVGDEPTFALNLEDFCEEIENLLYSQLGPLHAEIERLREERAQLLREQHADGS